MPASFIRSQRVAPTMPRFAPTNVVIVGLAVAAFAAPPGESTGVADDSHAGVPGEPLIDPEVFRPVLVPEGSLISRGIRVGESEAYYQVLDHARRLDPVTLRRAAERFLRSRHYPRFFSFPPSCHWNSFLCSVAMLPSILRIHPIKHWIWLLLGLWPVRRQPS